MHRLTSPVRPTSETERRTAAGNVSDRIDRLYERYLDPVFGYVLFHVPDHSEAEDITAETFAAAIGAYARFRGESSELAWLLGIARQKMAEAARRKRSRHRIELSEVELSERQQETLRLMLHADIRLLPEDEALRKEAQQMMRQLLAQLPEQQREALLLQVEHELPIREIARLLGRSEAATNSLLERGRAALFQWGRDYFTD